MSKVLYFLRELEAQDIDWFISIGTKMDLTEGEVLIEPNRDMEALYILIDGLLNVGIGKGSDPIATLGIGELVGELSFLDSSPPNATVTSAKASKVLALPRLLVESKLKKDHAFAARFFRAIGVLLANRLRQTVITLGYPPNEKPSIEIDSTDPDIMLAQDWFNFLLNKLKDR